MPILTERYFFICEKETLTDPRFEEALAFLQTTRFRAEISKLPGYDASQTGVITSLEEAFPNFSGKA